jgi:hypothetical protein
MGEEGRVIEVVIGSLESREYSNYPIKKVPAPSWDESDIDAQNKS